LGSNFKDFCKKFPYLDIQDAIIYYAIFNGYPLKHQIDFSKDLDQNIQNEILDKLDALKNHFLYNKNPENQKLIEKILTRLSRGDRKNYSVYTKEGIPQGKGRELFRYLFEIGEIQKETSREKPLRSIKKQPLKKSLRRYKIQDKIHLKNNFTRFWFTFIAPNLNKQGDITIEYINRHLEKFISLEFEKLSNQLIAKRYKEIISSGSYWDKNVEIDILIKRKSGALIAGATKYSKQKANKSELTKLKEKCAQAELDVDTFIIFSKNKFSSELKKEKGEKLQLFSLRNLTGLMAELTEKDLLVNTNKMY